MGMEERAAQFAPFAALTGFGAVITETARLTDVRPEPDESQQAALNERLQDLLGRLSERPEVTLTYFRPDRWKAGGAIVQVTGRLRRYDEASHLLPLEDGTRIPLSDLLSIP